MKKAVIGIDAAQANATYHVKDLSGRRLLAGKMEKSHAGYQAFLEALQAHGLRPADCLVAIEATGDCHLPWCEHLHAAGAEVLALNPLVAKRTTPASNAIRDAKSDPIDAESLANTALREGGALSRFRYRSAPKLLALHKQQAAARTVRAALTNLKKHYGSLLESTFPELRRVQLGEKAMRKLLTLAATPQQVVQLPRSKLIELIGEQAQAVLEAAKTSFAPAALAEACAPALQAIVKGIDTLEEKLRDIERDVAQAAATALDPSHLTLARTLPGFGEKTTPVILSHLPADFWQRQIPRKKKVAIAQAMFGIEPRIRTSGKWTGTIRLSKRGCRPARTALYQIATCSILHDQEMRAYYQRLRHVEKKAHKVALFCLARKHLRRLVAVLSSGTPFQKTSALTPVPA